MFKGLLHDVIKSSNDSFVNFITLCSEMDRYGFSNYCIIPILEKLLAILDNNKNYSYLPSLLNILDVRFKIIKRKNKNYNIGNKFNLEILVNALPTFFKVLKTTDIYEHFEWFIRILSEKRELRKQIEMSLNNYSLANKDIFSIDFSKKNNKIIPFRELCLKGDFIENSIYRYLELNHYKKRIKNIYSIIEEEIFNLKKDSSPSIDQEWSSITF